MGEEKRLIHLTKTSLFGKSLVSQLEGRLLATKPLIRVASPRGFEPYAGDLLLPLVA